MDIFPGHIPQNKELDNLFGMVIVFACNCMVIIGILFHVRLLLIPWLICYGTGKKGDSLEFKLISRFCTFNSASLCLPHSSHSTDLLYGVADLHLTGHLCVHHLHVGCSQPDQTRHLEKRTKQG